MDYAHLMAVEHSLQDLLNAMTACKDQGRGLVPSVRCPPARPQPGVGPVAAVTVGTGAGWAPRSPHRTAPPRAAQSTTASG